MALLETGDLGKAIQTQQAVDSLIQNQKELLTKNQEDKKKLEADLKQVQEADKKAVEMRYEELAEKQAQANVTSKLTPEAISSKVATNPGKYNSSNTYPFGQCTYYCKSFFGSRVGDFWGNAGSWSAAAQADGLKVDDSPVANSTVAVFQPGSEGAGGYGHVAVVVGVSGDSVTISEMNFYGPNGGGLGVVDQRIVSKSSAQYIHI